MGVEAKILEAFLRMKLVGAYLVDWYIFNSRLASNLMYRHIKNLLLYFARAVTDAGWDETRPTAVTPWNNSWSFRVCKS